MTDWRGRAFEDLARRRFDLLVVGGGIVGAGIACHAARLGLAVALVERADFGSETTSATSKLVHGGLRYLRLGDIRLVREAHGERRALARVVAPHLVRPLPFVLPLYAHGPYGPRAVRAALALYSILAREGRFGVVAPERAARDVPGLRLDGLKACGLYEDAWTHDGRLCLANVRAAAESGATVVNYAEMVALSFAAGRVTGAVVRDVLAGDTVRARARAVVNATGPWVDNVRRLEDPRARPSTRLSKGVHALLPLPPGWAVALAILQDSMRVSFALPWEGMLLVGTTDTPYDGAPDEVGATAADVSRVLAEAAVALAPDLLRPDAVRSSLAGLRVLPAAEGETVSARRETVLLRGPAGMLSVAGGKLTTYRRIALSVLAALRAELALHRIPAAPVPLPGAVDPRAAVAALARRGPALEPSVRSHLAHLYGSLSREVVAVADGDDALLRPLHAGAPDIAAQVVYAGRREWATSADDVLRRRTTLAHRGLVDAKLAARVDELLVDGAPA